MEYKEPFIAAQPRQAEMKNEPFIGDAFHLVRVDVAHRQENDEATLSSVPSNREN